MADSVCSYDLDQLDEAWLKEFNGERGMCGLPPVNEEQFERIVEELEVNTFYSCLVNDILISLSINADPVSR